MYDEDLRIQYFEWIQNIVYSNAPFRGISYDRLLRHLHNTKFVYVMIKDAHRYDDGVNLRNRFAYYNDIPEYLRAELFQSGDCSVLEMMVALAIHCEETMEDPFYGDRTAQWFWKMVNSLGLMNMTDRAYDDDMVDHILNRFMDRRYEPNGKGGLFTLDDCDEDLRNVEIWYQMNWWICENYM